MSTTKRLVLRGGSLVLLLALVALALVPAPARAECLWGVNFTYYYSTGGSCHDDCYAVRTCWGDTSGYITESYMGECYYCY